MYFFRQTFRSESPTVALSVLAAKNGETLHEKRSCTATECVVTLTMATLCSVASALSFPAAKDRAAAAMLDLIEDQFDGITQHTELEHSIYAEGTLEHAIKAAKQQPAWRRVNLDVSNATVEERAAMHATARAAGLQSKTRYSDRWPKVMVLWKKQSLDDLFHALVTHGGQSELFTSQYHVMTW
jgi:hypothetical protein